MINSLTPGVGQTQPGVLPRVVRYSQFNALYGFTSFSFLIVALVLATKHFDSYPIEICLFFLNGLLSIYGQTESIKRQASVGYLSFAFSYLFMSITPLIQLGDGNDPVFLINFMVARAAVVALIFTFLGLVSIRRVSVLPPPPRASAKWADSSNFFPLFIVVGIVTAAALILYANIILTDRDTFGSAQADIFGDAQTGLLGQTILTSVPFFGSCIGLRAARAQKRGGWTIGFVILLMLICLVDNPFTLPRFVLAGFAFFFIDYMSRGRAMKVMSLMLLAGVMSAPVFNSFRTSDLRNEGVEVQSVGVEESPFDSTFLSYDYDAFQTLCYSIAYVDEESVLYGSNLLGAALFFAPRTWWEDKPPPSAFLLYDKIRRFREIGTNNLSTALPAEGYLAFGWFGVVLVSFLYWEMVARNFAASRANDESFSFVFRCVFAGLTLIFLRGTLIVALAAVVGSVVSSLIPWMIFKIRRA